MRCAGCGTVHPDSPPCGPDIPDEAAEARREAKRRKRACPSCGSTWCERVTAGLPGLTPPRCPFADRERKSA